MAKIQLEISNVTVRESLEVSLLSSGHETVSSEPGGRPQADVVITDSIGLTERLTAFRDEGAYIIALAPTGSDPRKLAEFDDMLLEPLRPEELLLRLSVGAARSASHRGEVFEADGLTVDFSGYEIFAEGEPLDLTFTEFELLKALVENEGRVLSREQLLERVWGYDYFGGSRTVDVHIRRLRSKLGSRHQGLIETVRNVGYRLRKVGRY